MIDKFGLCPNCKLDWNKGDVFEVLRGLDVFLHADDNEVKKVANQYGWTAEKPTTFSKTVTHQIQGTSYIVCPAFVCGHVFNPATDEEFNSLYQLHLRLKEPVPDLVVQMNSEGVLETTPVLEEEESPFHEEEGQLSKVIDTLEAMEQEDKKHDSLFPLEQINERVKFIDKMNELISDKLGIPQERLGQPQTTSYGKNTTGSFSKLSEILRQGKRKAD